MSQEVVAEDATAESVAGNITGADFANRRANQSRESIGVEPPESAETLEEESSSEEEEAEDVGGNAVDDVLSQLNLDDLTEDQLKELSKRLGSRALSRFGELTARAKSAEEALAMVPEDLEADNPYSDVGSLESLRKKAEEVESVIEWAEDILFESEHHDPGDNVTEVDGKSWTKAQVREALKNAKKSKSKFIPDQFKRLQQVEDAQRLMVELGRKAEEEFDWIKEKDSPIKRQFVELVSDKRLAKVFKDYPDLGAKLPYYLAHAVQNMNGVASKGKPRIKPPSPVASTAARPNRSDNTSKAVRELAGRFRSSGSKDDFIAMRTKQFESRR